MFEGLDVRQPYDNRWQEAFELYKKSNPRSKLIITCRSCRETVLKWIKSQK